MDKHLIENKIEELCLPIVKEFNYDLVDVEFVRESGNWYLRVSIDKDEGITINDCEKVSRPLSDKLDESDPIPVHYFLEVSSPGINRPLKKQSDYLKFIGNPIKIDLFEKVNDSKSIEGILKNYENDTVVIENNGIETAINVKLIKKSRLNSL